MLLAHFSVFPCLMRCVIWMLHCCSKYHTPVFHRRVYLQIPLWILTYEGWETGTKLPRAQQSTEVTKWVDVNSSDHEQSLSNALRFGHACRAVNKHTSKNLVKPRKLVPCQLHRAPEEADSPAKGQEDWDTQEWHLSYTSHSWCWHHSSTLTLSRQTPQRPQHPLVILLLFPGQNSMPFKEPRSTALK